MHVIVSQEDSVAKEIFHISSSLRAVPKWKDQHICHCRLCLFRVLCVFVNVSGPGFVHGCSVLWPYEISLKGSVCLPCRSTSLAAGSSLQAAAQSHASVPQTSACLKDCGTRKPKPGPWLEFCLAFSDPMFRYSSL